ncbi:hypothetical protein EPO05_04670 [Patescibacteria group bacterium]|nr:MAG: hypothetical protein EPO05_04670 [Patescibacteria group bacterium]
MVSIVQKLISNEALEHNDVVLVIRPHWFYILVQFIPVIVIAGLLVASLQFMPTMVASSDNPQAETIFLFVVTTLGLLIWIYAAIVWVENYFDVLIIMKRKIININQKTLFVRRISEVKFERVQDVTVEVSGVFPTLLNYGSIQVQSAGENEWFTVLNIPDPYEVKNMIMELQKEINIHQRNELGELVRKEIHEELT